MTIGIVTTGPAAGSVTPGRGPAGARAATDAGLTLIEALVAMTLLAVAAGGFVRATERHIDVIAALEARAAGGWAADNALAEARLGLVPGRASLLGRDWRVAVASGRSDDPAVVPLAVTADAAGARVMLHGFRDAGDAR